VNWGIAINSQQMKLSIPKDLFVKTPAVKPCIIDDIAMTYAALVQKCQ
jgi:hypothetical protein